MARRHSVEDNKYDLNVEDDDEHHMLIELSESGRRASRPSRSGHGATGANSSRGLSAVICTMIVILFLHYPIGLQQGNNGVMNNISTENKEKIESWQKKTTVLKEGKDNTPAAIVQAPPAKPVELEVNEKSVLTLTSPLAGVEEEASTSARQQDTFRVVPIYNDGSSKFPSEVQVQVHTKKNFTPVSKKGDNAAYVMYSVTFVSHRKYTGTARLIHDNHLEDVLLYSWTPSFSGNYEILVHQIEKFVTGGSKSRLVDLPFPISITSKINVTAETSSEKLLPCQMVKKVDVFSQWNGDWIGPDFIDIWNRDWIGPDFIDETANKNQIRTGWSFLPSLQMNCRLETFSKVDLLSVTERRSIYILGTSIERGIFLSLVDTLLSVEEKKHFSESSIGKCWGRAFVKRGNIELTYQDFRTTQFKPRNASTSLECHDNKIAMENSNEFLENATLVWEEIFQKETSWPTVVYMRTTFTATTHFPSQKLGPFYFEDHVQSFVAMLPPSWNGTLFLGDDELNARKAGLVTDEKYQDYTKNLKGMTKRLNDSRVRWVDGMGISKEMTMYSEYGETHMSGSLHFHKWCGTDDSEMKVCSNVTEMMGQLLLGHALGKKSTISERKESYLLNAKSSFTLTYCMACPESLIPVHITPHPQLTCMVGPLQERSNGEVVDWMQNTGCPQSCLNQARNRTFQTQSSSVDVRYCSV